MALGVEKGEGHERIGLEPIRGSDEVEGRGLAVEVKRAAAAHQRFVDMPTVVDARAQDDGLVSEPTQVGGGAAEAVG